MATTASNEQKDTKVQSGALKGVRLPQSDMTFSVA